MKIEVPIEHKLLLSVREAVAYTGIGRESVTRLIKDQSTGIGRQVGAKHVAYRPALEDYIEKNFVILEQTD